MSTLQSLLVARQADRRALTGVIDIQGNRTRIIFGAVGSIPRVVLAVQDNAVSVLTPAIDQAAAPASSAASDDLAKANATIASLTAERDALKEQEVASAADHEKQVADLTAKLAASEAAIADKDKALAAALAASAAATTAQPAPASADTAAAATSDAAGDAAADAAKTKKAATGAAS